MFQQSPRAIDAGVFHNDVIAVGHRDTWVMHEQAVVAPDESIRQLSAAYLAATGHSLRVIVIPDSVLSLNEAVRSYFFNSQWLTNELGEWRVLFPEHCADSSEASQAIDMLREAIPELVGIDCVPVDQSMANGGGPACLRLRVIMTSAERQQTSTAGWLTESRYRRLVELVRTRYRDRLTLDDLRDESFARSCMSISEEARRILGFHTLGDNDSEEGP